MNQVEDYINKQTCFQCFLILRINKLNATTTPEKVCILQRFSFFFLFFLFLCMNIKGSLNLFFFDRSDRKGSLIDFKRVAGFDILLKSHEFPRFITFVELRSGAKSNCTM